LNIWGCKNEHVLWIYPWGRDETREKDDTLINLRKEVEFKNSEENTKALMFLAEKLNLCFGIMTVWNNETLLRNNNEK
jgi:hypothetical protein